VPSRWPARIMPAAKLRAPKATVSFSVLLCVRGRRRDPGPEVKSPAVPLSLKE
jgi:hypothetical protein